MAQRVAALYAEIDAKTDKFEKGLKGVDDSLQGAQGKLGKLGGAFEELTGVSLGAASGVAAIAGAVKALADSAQAAANWGDEMGDLAQLTGATVEETSKMAAAFELVGVSTGTLQSAIKGLTTAGLQPNFATIKKLSAEYQAIQDPVERNEFLFKKFGRAGLEMAEIMGKSAAELDRLSGAALRSGKVIGEDAAGAAEEFNINMAILKQRVEGAQIAIGNALLPTLNAAAQSFDTLVTIWQMGQVRLREMRGEIDGETAALEMLRIAGIEPATTATEDLGRSTASLTAESDRYAAQAAAYQAATEAYRAALEETTGTASDLKFGMSELTKTLVFNTAAQGLDKDAAYELAKSMGLVSESADSAKQILDDLRVKYDSNKDGAIDAAEAAAGYSRDVKALGDVVDGLQDKTVTITVKEVVYSELADAARAQAGKTPGGGRAAGGSFIVPAGYGMDSYPLANVQSGERVTVEPSGQVQTYGGDALLQIVQTLPAAIQRAVRDGMQMAMA